MAAKRLRNGSDDSEYDDELDTSEKKKMRASLSTVIKEAMMMKQMQKLCLYLEPLLRKVVQEEVGRVLDHSTVLFQSSPPMQIEEVESTTLRLDFRTPPSLPKFTGTKIVDSENNPLQIVLINSENKPLIKLPSSLKLQVVVLDGEFTSKGREDWTSAEFDRAIVKERSGRRPLLTGEFPVILRDGVATIPDLTFTDNSCWVRSQHFSIGVRVDQDQGYRGPRIKEAVTAAFRVKDHRGELYKKHFPPALGDEVWRLMKIGKDGAFHKRLADEEINNVHGFLKLLTVNPAQLRRILGQGMSDRMWEITISHAKTCPIGDRLFVYCKQEYAIFLNNICDLVAITVNGATRSPQQFNRAQNAFVQEMVQEAYQNFERLQEYDGLLYNNVEMQNMQSIPEEAPFYSSDIEFEDFGDMGTFTGNINWDQH